MQYRKEIDGLRALAVIPVILFHAGFNMFSGGYIGVDIFFVISGYLITSIILNEMDEGKFSLINFYERRTRRILPVMFFVMLVCIPFAWMWLIPADMKDFTDSIGAVVVFLSNNHFKNQVGGYFATATEVIPLIHTWSLAVEEQYYIIFPLYLMLTWRLGKRGIILTLAVTLFLSLVLAQWGAYTRPVEAFYLLTTRGWEIIVGALIAFYLQKRTANHEADRVSQISSLIGLSLIIYAIYAFDNQTLFPSLYTLIPIVGVILIILFAVKGTFVNTLLSTKLFVSIGLVSYSAYMWHQPLFAFTKYRIAEPNELVMLALCFVILPLAYLSWRFIEKPFRNRQHFNRKATFTTCGVFVCFFITVNLLGNFQISTSLANVTDNTEEAYYDGPETIMLLGDSHLSHLYYGLLKRLGRKRVGNYASSGCIPFYNVDRYDYRFVPGDCARNMNDALNKFESSAELKTIILSTMGPIYLDGIPFKGKGEDRVIGLGVKLINDATVTDRWKVFEIGMRNTLQRLTQLKNKNVIFFLDVPELGIEYRFCDPDKNAISLLGIKFAITKHSSKNCTVSLNDFNARTKRYHSLIYQVISDFPSVTLFDPTKMFCDDTKCRGIHK